VLAAFASEDYKTAGIVAFFMLTGEIIETRTAEGARDSIESLIKLTRQKRGRIRRRQRRRSRRERTRRRRCHPHPARRQRRADGLIVNGQDRSIRHHHRRIVARRQKIRR